MPQGPTTEAGLTHKITEVSVVVPVFNAMPYLADLLESLATQNLDPGDFEVILVDDGSTDGGSEFMDDFASRQENFTVFHQENHGWPGQPRNRGVAASTGRYLFFADADDVLAPQALRNMVDYADAKSSDIVIPSMAGTHGRVVPPWLYLEDDVDVALPKAFKTLAPQKLYRRSLLQENSIWFPEEKVRLEDGIFNAEAYLAAKRISILGGEALYFLRNRDDGQNISSKGFSPSGYTKSVARICAVVSAAGLDADTAADVLAGIYRRKCLKIYTPGRFERYSPARRQEWLEVHSAFIAEFIPESIELRLPEPYRSRSALVRRKDPDALLDLGRNEAEPRFSAAFWGSQYEAEGSGLELLFEVSVTGRFELRELVCEMRHRDGDGLTAITLRRDPRIATTYGQPVLFRGWLPPEVLHALRGGIHDLFLSTYISRKYVAVRVQQPTTSVLPLGEGETRFYRTAQGNLSLTVESN